MIKIIIADDHSIVRRGLKQILAGTPDMVVTGEANNSLELMDQLKENEFDLLILDITMPDMSGLDVLKKINEMYSGLPVLILSMHPEEEFAIESIRKGASGYVTKESAPEELINAVRQVYSGRKYVSPSLAEKLAANLKTDKEKPIHFSLSGRESQVMIKISKGMQLSDIAKELNLSAKTISTYRASVLKKMKMKSNAELTMYAVKNNLV
jgi:DNA-binding NarL/FixJ family response regulator